MVNGKRIHNDKKWSKLLNSRVYFSELFPMPIMLMQERQFVAVQPVSLLVVPAISSDRMGATERQESHPRHIPCNEISVFFGNRMKDPE